MTAKISLDLNQLPKTYRPRYYTSNGLTLSNGNTKLGPDTLVINLTSATDCPSRKLGLCQLDNPLKDCYALRPEYFRPKCLPYRRRQANYWDRTVNMTIYHDTKTIILQANRSKYVKAAGGIKYLRFSESGDFRNQRDVQRLNTIARFLDFKFDIITYGYSARSDLDFTQADSLLVKGSGHDNGNNGTVICRPLTKAQRANKTIIIDGVKHFICPGKCYGCSFCKSKTASIPMVIPKH